MTRPVERIISDDDVKRVHGYANFGSMTPRDVLADGVWKYSMGYSGGHTQLSILIEHGLIRKPKPGSYASTLTKKGREYLRATAPRPAELAAVLDREAAMKAEIERLTRDADALRISLSKARDPGRDPDYCYDEEWEYTMGWAEWYDLMDGHDLTEPTPVYTLYKGPTKWVVRVPTDDDSEVRLFDSEEDARAALTPEPEGEKG